MMDNTAQREMTLEEYVCCLPEIHRASKEYAKMRAVVDAVRGCLTAAATNDEVGLQQAEEKLAEAFVASEGAEAVDVP